jgi:Mrp family chromosome partitioning ATPase
MNDEEIKNTLIPHLGGQFERALPVLFTGAGFSLDAKNVRGQSIPSYDGLKKELWSLCFPGESFDSSASLQDLFEHALLRHRTRLTELMVSLLTVDADSLPDWYRLVFSMPWSRVYTLNVDDVAPAIARKFTLPRDYTPISATGVTEAAVAGLTHGAAEVVHLNGTISDIPDRVTFSVTQYAERLLRPEPWYVRLAADLLSRSVVFIGSRLDEPPLWAHLELRRGRGGRELRELRPRSYLVTPTLDRARRALLTEFNVAWIPMTAQQFAEQVLRQLQPAARVGLGTISRQGADARSETPDLPEVEKLASNPLQASEFLLGQEPIWADLQSGRAIARESDNVLWEGINRRLKESNKGIIVLTGTAGSGKSTALMRACLRLVADGKRVGWVDRTVDLSPKDIRTCMRSENPPGVLAIDDADVYGPTLASLAKEVSNDEYAPLVIVAIRSGKLDRLLNATVLKNVPLSEFSMPPLADSDISALLDVLDKANRLGILKGKSRPEQERAFREQAGRQLLVAMIQATSGRRFEEKVLEELTDLEEDAARIYALAAVASTFRFGLTRDEIIIATGDRSNSALNALDRLVARHVLMTTPDGSVWARHRVIAEILLDEFQKTGVLHGVLAGLALVGATKVSPAMQRSARPWRLLRSILNHEFLHRTIGLEPARNLFGGLEQLLAFDFHYWLQRGSLEVEFGDLRLAENFLDQAVSLAPDDPFVENERAYLLFRKAIDNPGSAAAPSLVDEATKSLEDIIANSEKCGAYPYHVLGSQGLAWARRGIKSSLEKGRFLARMIKRVEEGRKRYPRELELEKLIEDLKKEYLGIAVASPASLSD